MDLEPLLSQNVNTPVDGVVDVRGLPVTQSYSDGWNCALFIIVVEMAERFAYYGVSMNLITWGVDDGIGSERERLVTHVFHASLALNIDSRHVAWKVPDCHRGICSQSFLLNFNQPNEGSDGTSYPPTVFPE